MDTQTGQMSSFAIVFLDNSESPGKIGKFKVKREGEVANGLPGNYTTLKRPPNQNKCYTDSFFDKC